LLPASSPDLQPLAHLEIERTFPMNILATALATICSVILVATSVGPGIIV
jgi:hypothetical protein